MAAKTRRPERAEGAARSNGAARADRRVEADRRTRAAGAVVESLEGRRLLAAIQVIPSTVFQTIDGAGGNFAQGRYTGASTVNDSVGTYNLTNLKVRGARVGIPIRSWEPTNDDGTADPTTLSLNGFQTNDTNTKNVFLLMQDLKNRGIPIIASVWDVPDWLCSNPTATTGRLVNSYSELAESVGAFLKHAKDAYGVTVKYVSLNEPDIGFRMSFGSSGQADFIWNAIPKFQRSGWGSLSTLFMAGETGSPTLTYMQNLESEITSRGIWQYVGAVSFHAWGGLSKDYATWNGLYNIANAHAKPVYVNEMGYDATDYTSQQTWAGALNYAQIYHRAYAWSNASATFQWQYQNDYPLLNTATNTPYKTFYVVKQMTDDLTPGTQRIKALSNDEANVLSVGYKNAANGMTKVDMINVNGTTAQTASLTGLPNGTYKLLRTSSSQSLATIGTYTVTTGSLTLSLPAGSLSTLVMNSPTAMGGAAAATTMAAATSPTATRKTSTWQTLDGGGAAVT